MEKYFQDSKNQQLSILNLEIKETLVALKHDCQQAVAYYKNTICLRKSWGMASPYISFKKLD